MTLHEDVDRAAGTYSRDIRFSDGPNWLGIVVLYLRPRGRFLMIGYWPGHERSCVAGQWSRSDGTLQLRGKGSSSTCVISEDYGVTRPFVRVLQVDDEHAPPTLIAAKELPGWSLLGWAGPMTYDGQETIIENDWGPTSLSEVDRWIEHLPDE